jgi:hypothetical protein
MSPRRLDMPGIICFHSRQSAAEVCRVGTFCSKRIVIDGEVYDTSDMVLTVITTSHEDLAEAGWGEYCLNMCALEPDQQSICVMASFVCQVNASLRAIARRLEFRLL